jgi:hypothetical protein
VKYFNTIEAWRIELQGGDAVAPAPTVVAEDGDDLPF